MAGEDVLKAIDESEQRLRGMSEAILRSASSKLADSEWTVRDALCHVAARSNDVPRIVEMVEKASQPAPAPPPSSSPRPDANAAQIAERTKQSVQDLLEEAYRGHAEARQAVQALGDDVNRELPDFMGRGPAQTGQLVQMAYQRHLKGHVDAIEAAVSSS